MAEHKFIEKCHSYMDAGSTHNATESAKRFVSLYKKNDCLNVFCLSHSKRRKKKNSNVYTVPNAVNWYC